MGDVLDYERGKLCIGRWVDVKYDGGHGGSKNFRPAILKQALPKVAGVRFRNHGCDEYVPWALIRDNISTNGGPAPTPPPKLELGSARPAVPRAHIIVHELTAEERTEMNNAVNQQNAAKAANLLRSSLTDSDMLDLNDLPAKIKAGVADVEAARAQVKEAQAVLSEREKSLRDLREAARNALARIDAALSPAGGVG